MTAIKQEDLIQSVADAFQYISYYHPLDYIKALGEAYEREESPAAKDAIAQILTNSRMAAEGHRPICQDTGIGMVFIKVGMQVTWPDATMSVQQMIDEGVRRAYANPDNPLRASVLADPAGARKNTKDNTPAVVHFEIVEGDHVEVICAAKGGGSEAKSKFAMLNPSDDLVDWVLKKIPEMGAGWCPPGIIGIGIGGTPEGIITAVAMKCMGGEIQGKLWPRDDEERAKAIAAGHDLDRVLTTDILVRGENTFFAATGVTNGDMLRGVSYRANGATTRSLVMRSKSGTIRRIESFHRTSKLREYARLDL